MILRNFWKRNAVRRASWCAAAALLAIGATSSNVQAADNAYSLSLGTDFSSHFISYGADVWGGGDDISPFDDQGTMFVYGTLTLAITDQLSGFVNVWSDDNNNADSSIGGYVQEIDLNVGFTYTMEKWSFTLAHGCWWYASDTEHVIDFTVGYNDADMLYKGFALNPSVNFHYRYEGNGGQEEGWAIVAGIKPSYTLPIEKFPMTLSLPINVAFFDDEFQGGDGGYAYTSVGLGWSTPLTFIPEKYGAWSLGGSLTYYCTQEDQLPGNKEQGFFVYASSINLSI